MLYQLIWRRFIASQMMPAIYDTVSADIAGGEQESSCARLVRSLNFQGFLAVYEEKRDDDEKDDESRMLPPS